ncbi:LacI family transcriptional regulator [Motilibacter peucedani]|uniref:LacI family transcriptional regulator n=1 Tax=Motilibacter peucedani TaxID=598650 RepID=A0A420XRE7_9ACTN|nr:LacI family DNA-binding transcriptional regulator [Motilibacter peucedani]RKS77389.1 LacI family transcriptional regulator [Motilibacter peucedani]
MYASIKDVAALAGVSFQTASKVLNGQPGVASPATHERILAAARSLGYVPNALARGLVHQVSPTVGILSDDFSDAAIARFVTGAQREVDGAGHSALVVSIAPGSDPVSLLRRLQEHRVQGVLVVAPSLEGNRRLAAALPSSLPVVSLSSIPGARVPLVGSDHGRTGALAAEHLLALGHRRIWTVTGPRRRRVTASRLRGLRDTLAAGGVELPDDAVAEADWTSAGAYVATCRLLDEQLPPTAVFAQTDLMAIGVLRALSEHGLRVPDDCSVVGCDDFDVAEYLTPPLTTVRVPFEETGARAATLLLDSMRGERIPLRELLPVRLVERASTARPPPPADHDRPAPPAPTTSLGEPA